METVCFEDILPIMRWLPRAACRLMSTLILTLRADMLLLALQ